MNEQVQDLDLTACDREPIHVPGAIQPHGVLLVANAGDLTVTHAAGDIEGRLGCTGWHGAPVERLLGQAVAQSARAFAASGDRSRLLGEIDDGSGGAWHVTAHASSGRLLIEIEPALADRPHPAQLLERLERAAATFERAPSIARLCEAAAVEFRRLTGYDRVMIYRFLDDGAGAVVAEDRSAGQHSFLNHRFPASDIPLQARALYLRSLVRVIPDVAYSQAPLRPGWTEAEPLDMTDCMLRSIAPVHLQYLKNMEVGASASVSVVKDGTLWGLVACHNETPKPIRYEVRAGCRALAAALARQIKAKEEAEAYRERFRLKSFEQDIVHLLSRQGAIESAIAHHLDDVRRMLGGDGVAVVRGGELISRGACPPLEQIRPLAAWCAERSADGVFATDRLSELYEPGSAFVSTSGVLSVALDLEEPWIVLWFRAEEVEVVNWAGNPHKQAEAGPHRMLTPRASFEAWTETVRGHARSWTVHEREAAVRLRLSLLEVRRNRRLQELNQQLIETLREKDLLIQEKQFLIGEVNHRVQNSLQLVAGFLALQGRTADDPSLQRALAEARRRVNAVALVHRRLYRADQIETVDAARYFEELCAEVADTLGPEWATQLTLDLAPVMMPAERAIAAGLVLTELLINVNKYAYDGGPGPVAVALSEDRHRFRLTVADHGRGKTSVRQGFGTRMMEALVQQLGGELTSEDNRPGLRVTLAAPTAARSDKAGERN
ncbi:histidine kinase dimerization/phosphoacceptor domain -containing protein [Faunimonas sp. B44]|uniref:histidine kinase dimerization/phosphoacceptor domain -containing protein n=1 Tax=Faunimonas sp. B44 TaxID=3461493 RepID=UPI0040450B13